MPLEARLGGGGLLEDGLGGGIELAFAQAAGWWPQGGSGRTVRKMPAQVHVYSMGALTCSGALTGVAWCWRVALTWRADLAC